MAKGDKLTYDTASKELDDILLKMKTGEIGVDELAASVERASKLIGFCYKRLDDTEKKVEQILQELGLE